MLYCHCQQSLKHSPPPELQRNQGDKKRKGRKPRCSDQDHLPSQTYGALSADGRASGPGGVRSILAIFTVGIMLAIDYCAKRLGFEE
jgi:hypothetical protein